ncbi:DNA topoisomerase subunit B [Aurantibacter aestuarii]|uniref:DNA topoisomerase (ATP-hydrolyzing) n=1 Tax=Aurantibacter aestuarii TaxID=1266046 RepID=A0A2T1NEM4_9FLAO|nr:hypothetical protein [Aurantibacter aestuarii]PSG90903.1 hypothetical protein C7H52_06420 [Aurantibacter aestuarii]
MQPKNTKYSKEKLPKLKFEEHLKMRPGMYIGTGSLGIINLLKGLIADCVELTESENYFFQIRLEPEQKFDLEIRTLADISKFEKSSTDKNNFKNYFLKASKVLSTEFCFNSVSSTETFLTFKLDQTILNEPVDYLELSEKILQWCYLNRNSEVLLIDRREKFLNQNYFSFPEGVKYLYNRMVRDSLGKPEFEIAFDQNLNGIDYQIFLGYRTDWYPPSVIASFANDIHTECGGSLVDGIVDGLIIGCTKYVKDNNLIDYKIKKKKFKNGLILIASVRGSEFKYGGSFKETLEEEKIKKEVKKIVKQLTIDFISNNKEKADKFLWRFDEKQLTSGMY